MYLRNLEMNSKSWDPTWKSYPVSFSWHISCPWTSSCSSVLRVNVYAFACDGTISVRCLIKILISICIISVKIEQIDTNYKWIYLLLQGTQRFLNRKKTITRSPRSVTIIARIPTLLRLRKSSSKTWNPKCGYRSRQPAQQTAPNRHNITINRN